MTNKKPVETIQIQIY